MNPKIGQLVLYRFIDRTAQVQQYPAIVTRVLNTGEVNLTVFFDHESESQHMMGHPTAVEYSDDAQRGHTYGLLENTYRLADDSDRDEAAPTKPSTKGKGRK